MKRAVALIAVAVMAIICVIPMMDSSDADGETSISADFFCERDLSTVASTIDVVYYEGGPESEGKIVGSTSVIAAKDSSGFNKFSVTIIRCIHYSTDIVLVTKLQRLRRSVRREPEQRRRPPPLMNFP